MSRGVVARAANEIVVPGAAVERVIAIAAIQHVVPVAAEQRVVSRASKEGVGQVIALDHVISRPAEEVFNVGADVVAFVLFAVIRGLAVHRDVKIFGTRDVFDAVDANASDEPVCAVDRKPLAKTIIADVTEQDIVAVATRERVVAIATSQRVVERIAGQRIRSGSSQRRHRGRKAIRACSEAAPCSGERIGAGTETHIKDFDVSVTKVAVHIRIQRDSKASERHDVRAGRRSYPHAVVAAAEIEEHPAAARSPKCE